MTTTDRKAQGLPINTIIIAILAVAVLFVILFVFFRKGGEFTQATSDCVAQGGECVSGGCSADSIRVIGGKCGQGETCCRQLIGEQKKRAGEPCNTLEECASGFCGSGICN
jgi:hypothetical protein